MEKICYIIGAGDVPEKVDIKASDGDYIICADGGFRYSTLLGRLCDLVVGDFDSLGVNPAFGNTDEYSYPAIIADGDNLYITYTFKRKTIKYVFIEF